MKGREAKREDGVITAFFSLILMLVVAMLLCMAESARLSACGRIAESILRISTKSLLGSYDLPLYENYHIFGRSCEDISSAKGELEEELLWYMEQNLPEKSWLAMSADTAQIADLSVMTQDDGAMFYAQAIQYEKYRETEEFAEWLFAAAEEAGKAEKAGTLLQRALQAEQSAAKAEETLTELLGCLDGFVVEDSAVVRSIFGKPKTIRNFAKKLVPGGASEWLLEGNEELFQAQRGNYKNPTQTAEQIVRYKEIADEIEESLPRLWKEYEEIGEEFESEREAMAKRIEDAQQALDAYRGAVKGEISGFMADISGAREQSQKALELIARLEKEKTEARAELLAYEKELLGYEGEVPDAIYKELLQESAELLEQFSQGNEIGVLKDIQGMQEALQSNVRILSDAYGSMAQVQAYSEDAVNVVAGTTAAAGSLLKLQIRELALDYSNVKVPERSNPYTKMIRQFFQYGVLSIVAEDTNKISKGCISTPQLPSGLYTGKQSDNKAFSFRKLFQGTKEDVFSIQCGDIGGFLEKGAQELLEEFLYLSYLKRHFAVYTDENETAASGGSGTAEGLLYQLEYIIAGEESDRGNLSEIAAKIFLLRFAMNLVVIFASHECRTQIKSAAVAAVGFTGIGALIVMAELLIAMLWAAECSLTETSGLFMGGEVPFFPTAKSLAVPFSELSGVSKEIWHQKAKRYTEGSADGILKSYREYLYLFLALQERKLRTMRTMDVVQQVIQLKYNENFQMQSCICAVEAKADIIIPYLFLPAAGIWSGEGIKKQAIYGISY